MPPKKAWYWCDLRENFAVGALYFGIAAFCYGLTCGVVVVVGPHQAALVLPCTASYCFGWLLAQGVLPLLKKKTPAVGVFWCDSQKSTKTPQIQLQDLQKRIQDNKALLGLVLSCQSIPNLTLFSSQKPSCKKSWVD